MNKLMLMNQLACRAMLDTAGVGWEVMAQTAWLLWCDKSKPWLSGIRSHLCCMVPKSQAVDLEVSAGLFWY